MFRSSILLGGLRRLNRASAFGCTSGVAPMALLLHARFASNKNPYTVLGIKEGADKKEIKKAYRVMARKHHPDAPGGNHEKFQEIQEAYEQIKNGVWIKKSSEDGAAGGGSGDSNANRYSGFRYTTRTHNKSKVSYDDFFTEMHTGKVKKDPFADDDEDEGAEQAKKDPRKNPFALNEELFNVWLRFIMVWCTVFISLRIALFLMFPPSTIRRTASLRRPKCVRSVLRQSR
ncbi:chaperone protein DnaJ [Angomonas deanei]|nr:chaperone protein DnaJ [Angomonas deanei]|eukprot:EPY29276.1 chaperone protein DnaJ [Angomonas deanei]